MTVTHRVVNTREEWKFVTFDPRNPRVARIRLLTVEGSKVLLSVDDFKELSSGLNLEENWLKGFGRHFYN